MCKDKCVPYDKNIEVTGLAKAYIPMQKICELLTPMQSIINGTVFPELVSYYK